MRFRKLLEHKIIRIFGFFSLIWILQGGALFENFSRASPLDPTTVRTQLRALYPNLSDSEFQTKLDGTQNSFQFLRTFVVYFYWLSAQNPPAQLGRLNIAAKSGWCAGDAHPENFGTLLNDNGEASFRINDMDDSGPCPLYLDFLRYLTALRLSQGPNLDLAPVLQAYRAAVSKGSFTLSPVSQKLIEDSNGKTEFPKSYLKEKKTLERKEGYSDVADDEWKALKRALPEAYPRMELELVDAITFKKSSGGSGGLIRFRALVEVHKGKPFKDTLQVIEFKENQNPGISPVATGALPSATLRLHKTLVLERGDEATNSFDAVLEDVHQLSMLLRPRWKGQQGITMSDYGAQDLNLIFLDEASTLGVFHKSSANDPAGYLANLNLINPTAWMAATQDLANRFEQSFSALHSAHAP